MKNFMPFSLLLIAFFSCQNPQESDELVKEVEYEEVNYSDCELFYSNLCVYLEDTTVWFPYKMQNSFNYPWNETWATLDCWSAYWNISNNKIEFVGIDTTQPVSLEILNSRYGDYIFHSYSFEEIKNNDLLYWIYCEIVDNLKKINNLKLLQNYYSYGIMPNTDEELDIAECPYDLSDGIQCTHFNYITVLIPDTTKSYITPPYPIGPPPPPLP